MTINLRPITAENWRAFYRLTRTLTDEQRQFVADNTYSMLEALYEPETATAYGIYDGETPVGFLMTDYDADKREYWISRLMIGGAHQRKGYAHAAMQLIIDQFRQTPDCDRVYISFVPENEAARVLYQRLGFVDTGVVEEGEIVFCLNLADGKAS